MAGPIRISILADAKNAVGGLKDTENAADGLGTKFGGLAKSALKYAAAGAALGAVAAVAGLGKLAVGAAEDEQAQALLAKALQNSAGATKAQIAATEAYISKAGVATGVTDDELRPALSKLVTATGSVSKAQKLTSLAMDVSAGSGKSLESVTAAVAKAQTGSLGGLSKLGIATKNADGSTKSLAEVTKDLGTQFGGAAATKAETLVGKVDRLKLIASEAGESIGSALIPIITNLADFALNKAGPAIENVATKVQGFLSGLSGGAGAASPFLAVLSTLAGVVTGTIVPALTSLAGYIAAQVVPIFNQIATIVQTRVVPILASLGQFFVGTLVPAVIAIYTAVASNLKPVFDQLSQTFQTKVLPTISKLLGKFQEAQPTLEKVALAVVKVAGKAIELGAAILGKVLPPVIQFAGFLLSKLIPVVADVVVAVVKAIGKVIDFGQAVINGAQKVGEFANRVADRIGDVVGFFADLPGKIKDKLAGAATLLLSIGGSIVDGLRNGIANGAERVLAAVQSLVDRIPKKIRDFLGINSPSKLTTQLGRYVADGLALGIGQGEGDVDRAMASLSGRVTRTRIPPLTIGADGSVTGGLGPKGKGTRQSETDRLVVLLEQIDHRLDRLNDTNTRGVAATTAAGQSQTEATRQLGTRVATGSRNRPRSGGRR